MNRRLQGPDVLQIAIRSDVVGSHVRKVALRLKRFDSGREHPIELRGLGFNLLFKKGREHNRRNTGLLHSANVVDTLAERAGRRHKRRAQLKPQILGGKVDHLDTSGTVELAAAMASTGLAVIAAIYWYILQRSLTSCCAFASSAAAVFGSLWTSMV